MLCCNASEFLFLTFSGLSHMLLKKRNTQEVLARFPMVLMLKKYYKESVGVPQRHPFRVP